MKPGNKKIFVDYLNQYGTNFSYVRKTKNFLDETNKSLLNVYTEHLGGKADFVHPTGRESNLSIIHKIFKKDGEDDSYYCEAEMSDMEGIGKAKLDLGDYKLPFLLKDREYFLKQQLTYIWEMYGKMIKEGAIDRDFIQGDWIQRYRRNIGMPPVTEDGIKGDTKGDSKGDGSVVINREVIKEDVLEAEIINDGRNETIEDKGNSKNMDNDLLCNSSVNLSNNAISIDHSPCPESSFIKPMNSLESPVISKAPSVSLELPVISKAPSVSLEPAFEKFSQRMNAVISSKLATSEKILISKKLSTEADLIGEGSPEKSSNINNIPKVENTICRSRLNINKVKKRKREETENLSDFSINSDSIEIQETERNIKREEDLLNEVLFDEANDMNISNKNNNLAINNSNSVINNSNSAINNSNSAINNNDTLGNLENSFVSKEQPKDLSFAEYLSISRLFKKFK